MTQKIILNLRMRESPIWKCNMVCKLDGKRVDIICRVKVVLRSPFVIADIQHVPFPSTCDRTVVMAAAVIAGDGRGRYYLLMSLLARLVLQYPPLVFLVVVAHTSLATYRIVGRIPLFTDP